MRCIISMKQILSKRKKHMAVAKSLDKIIFQDTDEHENYGLLREFRVQRVLHLDFATAMTFYSPLSFLYHPHDKITPCSLH